MAALSITVTQVQPGTTNAEFFSGIAGGTITAGMSVYSTTSGLVSAADCDASAAAAAAIGVALHAASAGQPIRVQTAGDVTLGAAATMTVGLAYYVGDDAGEIFVVGDLASGDYVTLMGLAISASVLRMPARGPLVSGVQVPA